MLALALFLLLFRLRSCAACQRRHVSSAEEVERIRAAVKGWDLGFEVLYGGELLAVPVSSKQRGQNMAVRRQRLHQTMPCKCAVLAGWFGRAVHEDAKAAVLSSADRYVGLLRGTLKRHWNS